VTWSCVVSCALKPAGVQTTIRLMTECLHCGRDNRWSAKALNQELLSASVSKVIRVVIECNVVRIPGA